MNILVYGWYHQENLGDDLFMDAFRALWPTFDFKFVNIILSQDLKKADAVFIGGGSFLGEALVVENQETYQELKEKRVFYIGVGAETKIHATHYELIRLAELIAVRSSKKINPITDINRNVMVIPDLVHYLKPSNSIVKLDKSVLVIPNIAVVPQWNDDHWKHAAWDYFRTEFAQFLDNLVEDGHTLHFLPLCTNYYLDDRMAAAEIVNRMVCRSNKYLLPKKNDLSSVTETMSRYNLVITQRYHGIVLAEMTGTPYISISHHDKLKNPKGQSLSYYGISKDKLQEQFHHAKVSQILPIDRDMFVPLQQAVYDALCGHQK